MLTTADRRLIAFLDGPDDPGIANPIHSTEVAASYGFRGPLVGGVTVYGWCVPPILDVLGESWLDEGWADVAFRQPVFPGDELCISVTGSDDGAASVTVTTAAGTVCITGRAGLGRADWVSTVWPPANVPLTAPPAVLPGLTLQTAPIGRDLEPMRVDTPAAMLEAYARDIQRDPDPRWSGTGARLHPGWLAARMAPLLRHNFSFGPSIHARSQVQHLQPAIARENVVVRARFSQAYARKGHEYGVFDGSVSISESAVFRVRHTSIFRPAKRAS